VSCWHFAVINDTALARKLLWKSREPKAMHASTFVRLCGRVRSVCHPVCSARYRAEDVLSLYKVGGRFEALEKCLGLMCLSDSSKKLTV